MSDLSNYPLDNFPDLWQTTSMYERIQWPGLADLGNHRSTHRSNVESHTSGRPFPHVMKPVKLISAEEAARKIAVHFGKFLETLAD